MIVSSLIFVAPLLMRIARKGSFMKDLCMIFGGLGCCNGKSSGQEAPPVLAFCEEEDLLMWIQEQGLDVVFLDVDAFPWGYGLECECDEEDNEREPVDVQMDPVIAPRVGNQLPARILVIEKDRSYFSNFIPAYIESFSLTEIDGIFVIEVDETLQIESLLDKFYLQARSLERTSPEPMPQQNNTGNRKRKRALRTKESRAHDARKYNFKFHGRRTENSRFNMARMIESVHCPD